MTITFVDYRESLTNRLIQDIVDRGYLVGSTMFFSGIAVGPHDKLMKAGVKTVAIVEKKPTRSTQKRLFVFPGAKRRRIVAVIKSGRNEATGASDNSWVVKTHGEEYLDETKTLIEQISKKFGVTAQISLVDKEPAYEGAFA